jgi:hypothetical protein
MTPNGPRVHGPRHPLAAARGFWNRAVRSVFQKPPAEAGG